MSPGAGLRPAPPPLLRTWASALPPLPGGAATEGKSAPHPPPRGTLSPRAGGREGGGGLPAAYQARAGGLFGGLKEGGPGVRRIPGDILRKGCRASPPTRREAKYEGKKRPSSAPAGHLLPAGGEKGEAERPVVGRAFHVKQSLVTPLGSEPQGHHHVPAALAACLPHQRRGVCIAQLQDHELVAQGGQGVQQVVHVEADRQPVDLGLRLDLFL